MVNGWANCSLPRPTVCLERSDGCSDDPKRDLARGRMLASRGDFRAAILVYDRAVRRAPTNAVLRAERGYALLKAGDLCLAERELEVALLLATDRGLESTIHFNLGQLYTEAGDPEQARRHLASAELRGNAAAKRMLMARSRCRAVWTLNPKIEPAPLASSLRELIQTRQWVNCPALPEIKTERQASDYLCRECGGGSWSDDGPCATSFPLEVNDGYMSFHSFRYAAEEFPDRVQRYIYFRSSSYVQDPKTHYRREGPWLVIESNSTSFAALDDGLGHRLFETDNHAVYMVENVGDPNGEVASCVPMDVSLDSNIINGGGALPSYGIPSKGGSSVRVYAIATRAPLLEVISEDDPAKLQVSSGKVVLSSAGCSETIDLSGQ